MNPSAKRLPLVLGVAVLSLLATGAAAADPTDSADVGHLSLRTPQSSTDLLVNGIHLTNADVQLANKNGSLRGRAFGAVVFLDLQEREVGGSVNSLPTRLLLLSEEKDKAVTTVRGNFLGALTDFQFGPRELVGSVGVCTYTVKAIARNTYQGERSCGGAILRPVTLEIPEALVKQGRPMLFTALAILLAHG